RSWFQLMRPMTWTGTITPILAGTAFAMGTYTLDFIAMFVVLITALLVQISANMLNDYFDFKNGQDTDRWMTDISVEEVWQPRFHQIHWMALVTFSLAIVLDF